MAMPAAPKPMALPASKNQPAKASQLWRRGGVLAALAVGTIGFLLSEWTICPFAVLTHHPCPGCGMTRATLALMQGHFSHAIRVHPLSPVVAPLVGFIGAEASIRYVIGRVPKWMQRLKQFIRLDATWPWAVLLAAVVGIWLARFAGAFGGPVAIAPPLY